MTDTMLFKRRRDVPPDIEWWITAVEHCSVALITLPMESGGTAAPRIVIIDHRYLDDEEYQKATIKRVDNVCCWWWDNRTGGIDKYYAADLDAAVFAATAQADRICRATDRHKFRDDAVLRAPIYKTWDDWFAASP